MTRAFQMALALHMIDATERGTGYRAFDPQPKPSRAAWAILLIVVAFLVGAAVGPI